MKSKKTRVRASKKPAPKRAGKAASPPDNPFLRHKELGSDRRVEGEEAKLANLRLEAWQHSQGVAGHETGGPLMATIPAAAPGGIAMVAPVAGTSNWVQLGPTVIPNGQTHTDARVLVTGRVTAIVVD